jgi:pimeloyl-ACP methyl ester carboxylesterase
MSEVERLREYYPFDTDVLERVSEVAEQQRSSTWTALQGRLPEIRTFTADGAKAIEVLDITPNDYDETQVYHLPMGNALDESMSTRVATLAAAQPNTRVIGVSNPGSPGQNKGKLKLHDLAEVWKGELRPAIEPTLQYLSKQGLEAVTHIGFSYGADRAAASAHYAEKYDQQVPQGVFMEPASIKNRSVIELAKEFNSTAAALDGYIKATDSEPYFEARKLAEKRGNGLIGYVLGLSRLSNLAIAHSLTTDDFWWNIDIALTDQTDMKADIIWGSDSELASNDVMTKMTGEFTQVYGSERVRATVIEGQKHAMGDDIFLHTAMVLQSLK